MLKYSVVSEPQPFLPSPPCESNPSADPGSHGRMREAGRSIGDRVRRVLVPEGSPIATLRFLVVDDHPDSADSLAAILEILGWPVRTCYDPASAILIAADFDPQVCLLDLKMPGMDGFQLAGHLKAHACGGPLLLIATTGLGDAESRRKSLAAGFHCHLVKPIDVPTLIDAVMRLWDTLREQGGFPPRSFATS